MDDADCFTQEQAIQKTGEQRRRVIGPFALPITKIAMAWFQSKKAHLELNNRPANFLSPLTREVTLA